MKLLKCLFIFLLVGGLFPQTQGFPQLPEDIVEKLKTGQVLQGVDTTKIFKKVEIKEARKTIEKEVSKPSPIEKSFGGKLKQFGYDMFLNMPVELAFENVPVSPDYIVGPGDNLVVYVWGKFNETFNFTVDRDGKIYLPESGVLYVWGKRFDEVKRLISLNLKANYSGISVDVSLGALRTFPVYIVGEVSKPGIYNITPLINPLQCITLAGGAKKTGSLRRIVVIKKMKKRVVLDLYDLLTRGRAVQNVLLDGGDIIYVPPIGDVVGITGSVKRPGIYELNGENSLNEVIKLSGGLLPTAYLYHIQVVRIKNGERRVVFDLDFREPSQFEKKASNFKVVNGDLIKIESIPPERYNFVTIEGNVWRPGEYELKKGWKVSDLIRAAKGLKEGTYMEYAVLERYIGEGRRRLITFNLEDVLKGRGDIPLEEWDVVRIFSLDDVLPKDSATVAGAVSKPGKYRILEDMTLRDLIFKAGNLLPEADSSNVEIMKFLGDSLVVERVDLRDGEVLSEPVERNEIVYVRYKPNYYEVKKVKVTGRVNFPGTYVLRNGDTFGDILRRAGGLKDDAFLEGTYLIRKSVRKDIEDANRRFSNFMRAEILKRAFPAAQNEPGRGEDYSLLLSYEKELVKNLTRVFTPGRIYIDMSDTTNWSFELQDGDSIYIPPVPSTVEIIGAVANPGAVEYEAEKSVGYYIDKVGGFTKDADKSQVFIISPSGFARRDLGRVSRGDIIVVPPKIKTPLRVIVKDLTAIISQLLLVVMAIYQLSR